MTRTVGLIEPDPQLIAARFVQGVGGAMALAGDPRHDRDHGSGAGPGEQAKAFTPGSGGAPTSRAVLITSALMRDPF